MSVSGEDVEHVAGLARLAIDEDEVEALTDDLNGILEHVAVLGEVPDPDVREASGPEGSGEEEADVPEVEPRSRRGGEGSPDPLTRRVRELAPEWRDGFFVVPRLSALGGDADAEDGG